jgi:hypothetical protein
MMDAFGVDSVFEGRHRAMMAHPPVSKAATMALTRHLTLIK